jgi:hypothetical protein
MLALTDVGHSITAIDPCKLPRVTNANVCHGSHEFFKLINACAVCRQTSQLGIIVAKWTAEFLAGGLDLWRMHY